MNFRFLLNLTDWYGNEGCKSANELFKMYLETVGRNATLILNFPPNQARSEEHTSELQSP